jgi:hypothetical protein
MTNIVLSQTGTGASRVIAPDYFRAPFAIGLGAVISGTATVSVEATFEDPLSGSFNPSTAVWFAIPDFSAISATKIGRLDIPCRGLRVNVTAGAGTVTLYVQQAGER